MSNITLYYIKGLSRHDTIRFASDSARDIFFDDHANKKVVDTSFYPPHYTNVITLSTSDFDFDDAYNYCSLEYGNRRYYYFIDTINYISEDVIEIHITMDTVITYQNRMTVSSAEVTRASIKRWVNHKINRSYIRENLSTADFQAVSVYTVLNDNMTEWTIHAQFTSDIDGNQTFGNVIQTYRLGDELYSKGVVQYFSPYRGGTCTIGSNTRFYSNKAVLDYGATKPMVSDVFLIPFNAIVGYSAQVVPGDVVITGPTGEGKMAPGDDSYAFYNTILSASYRTTNQTFAFYENISATPLSFEDKYVPAMIDENYIMFTFGDAQERTSYPLHTLDTNSLYVTYWADLSSGVRYYNINKTVSNPTDNQYQTIVANQNVLHYDLKSDPYLEYYSRNKATWQNALMQDIGSAVEVGSMMYHNNNKFDAGLSELSSTRRYWDKRYKTPHLRKSGRAYLKDISTDYNEGVMRAASHSFSISAVAEMGNHIYNLQHSPSSIKQTGVALSDVAGKACLISMQIAYVADFHKCAELYETHGYAVHEFVTYNPLLMRNRRMYDVVQCDNIIFSLTSTPVTEEIISDITNRLADGMRVWHTAQYTDSGVITYDLVCKRWANIDIGALCIYDNVEV